MTTTGRYALLNSDLAAVRADGAKHGDRDACEARRLGVPFDSWPGSDHAEHMAANALAREGASWDLLSPNSKASVLSAWIDGYRPAYGETYYESEEASCDAS